MFHRSSFLYLLLQSVLLLVFNANSVTNKLTNVIKEIYTTFVSLVYTPDCGVLRGHHAACQAVTWVLLERVEGLQGRAGGTNNIAFRLVKLTTTDSSRWNGLWCNVIWISVLRFEDKKYVPTLMYIVHFHSIHSSYCTTTMKQIFFKNTIDHRCSCYSVKDQKTKKWKKTINCKFSSRSVGFRGGSDTYKIINW